MLKNHSVHIIATYALLILASPLFFTSDASAQAVNCPAGYVCTPFRQTQVPSCPVGYVCTPVNSAGTNTGINANPAFNNGYYYSGSDYTNTQNLAYQNIGSSNSVNSVCHLFNRDLSIGSTGQDVVALQNFLISGGYSLPNIASGRIAKGNFGANTAAALRQYQTANGINENGYFGPLTRAKIRAECSAGTATPVNPTPTTAITLRGPVIDTFTVTPPTVVEGRDVTFSGRARQGSFCLAYHKAIVVDSETPPWATTTNRWTKLDCTQSAALPNTRVSTAKNPYAFNGPGTYKVRWQVQDSDGRLATEERTVVVTSSNAATPATSSVLPTITHISSSVQTAVRDTGAILQEQPATVYGSNLGRLVTVTIGSQTTAFIRLSATEATFIVPPLPAGQYRLQATGLDGPTNVVLVTVVVPVTVAPVASSTVDRRPVGYLDNVSCSLINGWAYDPDNTAVSIGVHFYAGAEAGAGGTFIGDTVANVSRPDVNSVRNVTGNHGFSFPIPASLRDGAAHRIYAYGINSAGSASQNNAALSNNGLVITGCGI